MAADACPPLTITSTAALPNTAVRMPRLGFGVYGLRGSKCVDACVAALAAGCALVDTAQLYGNEAEVGAALRRWSDDDAERRRADVFVTTKIMRGRGGVEANYRSALESIAAVAGRGSGGVGEGGGIGGVEKGAVEGGGEEGGTGADDRPVDYVDLFLVHTPHRGHNARRDMWLALERLHAEGRARAIGVSNYGIEHIEEMREYATIWPPHVNQIEVSHKRRGRSAPSCSCA